jgi:hypothetical protein
MKVMERNPKAEATREKYEERDENREIEDLVEIDNRNLAMKAQEGRAKAICLHCGGVLKHKTHGYCEKCTELRAEGKIPPRAKAEPHYKQRQCKCGNWFSPEDAATKKCKQCKEKDMETKHTSRRVRRYTTESKALYVRKVNEFRLKGMGAEEAYAKAGALALGAQGNSFSYYTWRKQLGIETPPELMRENNPPPRPGKGSVYSDEKRIEFLDDVDRRVDRGATRVVACQLAGKAILDKSMPTHTYRDWSKTLRKTKAPKSSDPRQANRSKYPESARLEFIERVDDMRSRGFDTTDAVRKASKAILGEVRENKFYFNQKTAFKRKQDKNYGKKTDTKAKAKVTDTPKPQGGISLESVTAWLETVDDADTLIALQEVMDERKAIVHKTVEAEAERLLAQLGKLTVKKPKPQPELEDDALHTESKQSTGQTE